MTDVTPPLYQLSSLTDKQWDRQLLSQERIEAAKIESAKQVELERLRNERQARADRRDLIKNILAGLAIFLVVALIVGGVIYGIQASSQRNHEKGIACIEAGGRWLDEGGGGETRCDRP